PVGEMPVESHRDADARQDVESDEQSDVDRADRAVGRKQQRTYRSQQGDHDGGEGEAPLNRTQMIVVDDDVPHAGGIERTWSRGGERHGLTPQGGLTPLSFPQWLAPTACARPTPAPATPAR